MAKRDVSEIVRGAGFVAHFMSELDAAVRKHGGTDEDLHRLVTPDGKETLDKIAELVVQDRRRPYPAEGEVFTLTMDANDPECDPLAMVREDGYNPAEWKHVGDKLTGVHTGKFRLVSVGYCRDLDEARQKLAAHGALAQGQWREAFKEAYPTPDGKGSIGFPDPSWVGPHGDRDFPYVGTDGKSSIRWAADELTYYWRWLVAVCE